MNSLTAPFLYDGEGGCLLSVIVTAKEEGNYTGSLEADWEIKKANIQTADKEVTVYANGGPVDIALADVPAFCDTADLLR